MQSQRPVLVQEQRLKMNPQLYQSIQLMAMPIQDLKFRIQQELEANPALEMVEDRSTVSLDDMQSGSASTESEEYQYFENSSDPGFTRSSYDDSASDLKRQFMEGALARPESLQEHLLWQLRLQPISDEQFRLGELLIRNLDDNGFHIEDPLTLVKEELHDELRHMMEIIRSFEPVGTCVADYRESLVAQAQLAEERPEHVVTLIREHLDALERGKIREVARKMRITEEAVEQGLRFMRSLTPFPGREFSNEEPTYVIPDLLVKRREGEFVIVMNDEEIPVLGVNSLFDEMSRNKTNGGSQDSEKEAKRFVSQRVKDARWFISSIQQRNATLQKVARAIIEFQRDFFVKGPKYLVPLTLKDIAGEVGVHEATVSRISNAKYMQTEWGIFELKYFFSNSISGSGSDGSRYSKEGVKERVREILREESSSGKHLSDQRIADLLAKRGINIARRTVAKYRKELDISSSYER